MAKVDRPGKGESRLCLPRDYTVVDTETTGLSSETCGLIEVGALRVRDGEVTETFSTLIQPPWREVQRGGEWTEGYVDDFIQGLTGITNEMLEDAPSPEDALPQVEEFLGEDLILGHNVGFDMAFLYDSFQKYLGRPCRNDSLDHLRIAKKMLPEMPHHRLGDVAEALGVSYEGAHRALTDCWITYRCYEKLRQKALSQGTEEDFLRLFEKKKRPKYPGIPDHPFYKKRLAFAGELKALSRDQAAERVMRAGAKVEKEVTDKTDYLVVAVPGDKALPGKDGGPVILPEGAFLKLLGEV
jgi:DNA polymerase-3 subunit epsilon